MNVWTSQTGCYRKETELVSDSPEIFLGCLVLIVCPTILTKEALFVDFKLIGTALVCRLLGRLKAHRDLTSAAGTDALITKDFLLHLLRVDTLIH